MTPYERGLTRLYGEVPGWIHYSPDNADVYRRFRETGHDAALSVLGVELWQLMGRPPLRGSEATGWGGW